VGGVLGPGHPCAEDAVLLVSWIFGNSVRYSCSGCPGETVRVLVIPGAALSGWRSPTGAAPGRRSCAPPDVTRSPAGGYDWWQTWACGGAGGAVASGRSPGSSCGRADAGTQPACTWRIPKVDLAVSVRDLRRRYLAHCVTGRRGWLRARCTARGRAVGRVPGRVNASRNPARGDSTRPAKSRVPRRRFRRTRVGGRRCHRRLAVFAINLMPDTGRLAREGRVRCPKLDAGPLGRLFRRQGQPAGRDDHPEAFRVLVWQGAVQLPHVVDGDRLGKRVALALDGEIAAAGIGCGDVGTAVTAWLAADHHDARPSQAREQPGAVILELVDGLDGLRDFRPVPLRRVLERIPQQVPVMPTSAEGPLCRRAGYAETRSFGQVNGLPGLCVLA
jgi:hypothetical protein